MIIKCICVLFQLNSTDINVYMYIYKHIITDSKNTDTNNIY